MIDKRICINLLTSITKDAANISLLTRGNCKILMSMVWDKCLTYEKISIYLKIFCSPYYV